MLVILVLLVNLAGCYGSFSLTRKLYTWNGSFGDKWINTVVFWILLILPAYEATSFIDFVVLNTVEFWTGSNPLAMQDGMKDIKYVSNSGKTYRVELTKNQIKIVETIGPEQGKFLILNYSPTNGNWSMFDGKNTTDIAAINKDKLSLFFPNGDVKDIQLSY
jgi:hypothetical protein